MNKWLDKALAAASEVAAEPAVQDAVRSNSSDSADSSLAGPTPSPSTCPNCANGPIGPIGTLHKQADRTNSNAALPTHSQKNSAELVVPEQWVTAVARLQQSERPALTAPDRWQQILTDANRLLNWVPMLEAMGWTCEDVLGRDRLDHMSLVWLMQGQRVSAVTASAVVFGGASGEIAFVYRRVEK